MFRSLYHVAVVPLWSLVCILTPLPTSVTIFISCHFSFFLFSFHNASPPNAQMIVWTNKRLIIWWRFKVVESSSNSSKGKNEISRFCLIPSLLIIISSFTIFIGAKFLIVSMSTQEKERKKVEEARRDATQSNDQMASLSHHQAQGR